MTMRLSSFRACGVEISQRAGKLAHELPEVEQGGQAAVGAAVVAAVARNMGGQSVFMSGVGEAGAKVDVRFKQIGRDASVYMTGPAHLLERDSEDHEVGTGFNTKVRVNKSGEVRISESDSGRGDKMEMPDGRWATGPFRVRGSKGRHMFRDGVKEVEPVQTAIYEKGVRVAALKAGFG